MILRLCCALLILSPLPATGSTPTSQDTLVTLRVVKVDTNASAPVVLANDTLFFVQAGIKGFSPAQRAASISRRIMEVVAESGIPLDSIMIVDSEVSSDIVFQDRVIL